MRNTKETAAGKLADWFSKMGVEIWRGHFGEGEKVNWSAIAGRLDAAAARCREHAGEAPAEPASDPETAPGSEPAAPEAEG